MMKNFLIGLLFLFSGGLFMWSCGPKDLPEPEVDLSQEQLFVRVLSDLNTVQASIDSAYSTIDPAYPNNFGGCGAVTVTVNPGDTLITIDFTGAACHDTLAGQVEVHHKGSYSLETLTDSIVFTGFTLNGRSITGYRLRSIDTAASVKTFKIEDHITSIESPARNKISIQSALFRTDNATSVIYGSAKGNTDANAFTASISSDTPLTFDNTCGGDKSRFPVGGSLTFNNTTQNLVRVIHFGYWNGYAFVESCTDNKVATFISPKTNIYTFDLE
jgi:hypothetical protein